MKKTVATHPWLIALPVAGPFLYPFSRRTERERGLLAFSLLAHAVVPLLSALLVYAVMLSPFFIEPGVRILRRIALVAALVTWAWILFRLRVSPSLPAVERISRWKWVRLLDPHAR